MYITEKHGFTHHLTPKKKKKKKSYQAHPSTHIKAGHGCTAQWLAGKIGLNISMAKLAIRLYHLMAGWAN
jgi:hypothetical protein